MNSIKTQISQDIEQNDVVLFMKGTADMPLCGFSANVVAILKKLDIAFKDVNVLDDENLRDGIKQFSNWPTIPQLYIKGEFIGGCDIVKEMFTSGEFTNLLSERNIKYNN